MSRSLLATLALLGASVGAAQSASVRTVNVGLGYVPNVQFTPFYVADKLGYFKAEGLNVKFQHGYVNELMPLLLQGKLDFVVGDPEDAIFARTQGADVRYVMAMYQKTPVTVFSLKPLNSAADLRGKTLGIPGPYGSTYNAVQALLGSAGLDGNVRLANIGFTQLDAVRAGRVDAAAGYVNNEVVQLRASGQKVYTLDVTGAYPMVGVGLITTGKNLSGDLARKVVRASQRGLKFTTSDPARAFKLAQPVFGASGGGLDILKASVPLMGSTYTAQNGLGASDPAAWTKAVAALVKQDKLPAVAKASEFYTNTLISKTVR
ncbi:ABC transporter substrate-binding protein [Deinococcus gobiensis]|uniref:Putative sulfonate/nitrate/taurine transport system substrate-binding protein n=1 Tax=Deinococcus gobiensis (strain DSM 21396 / JCM 16679 / CGMCC 1.7299 / I-0) TaxID=745776 RepID=H8GUT6_DEIGI|nr:ABC transporter substrate-binding protein [Deinococcus gobiensis]AFD24269.1 Putative sulfonate/nitrate/taurine transport system substrate-binding protein [Deinococcus gobiensis I-0]